MWTLYQKAKLFSRLPSELLRIGDEWIAYQFDNAVALLGTVIENESQRQHNVGSEREPKWETKYSLAQLLDDDFRLPAPERASKPQGLAGLMNMPGVKVVKAKG